MDNFICKLCIPPAAEVNAARLEFRIDGGLKRAIPGKPAGALFSVLYPLPRGWSLLEAQWAIPRGDWIIHLPIQRLERPRDLAVFCAMMQQDFRPSDAAGAFRAATKRALESLDDPDPAPCDCGAARVKDSTHASWCASRRR